MGKPARKVRRPTKTKQRPGAYVGFRAPVELKEKIEEAARTANRSISTETQLRVERTFRDDDTLGGPETAALLLMFAGIARLAEAHAGKTMWSDRETYRNVVSNWHRVLNIEAERRNGKIGRLERELAAEYEKVGAARLPERIEQLQDAIHREEDYIRRSAAQVGEAAAQQVWEDGRS